jgi:hypothetical protein
VQQIKTTDNSIWGAGSGERGKKSENGQPSSGRKGAFHTKLDRGEIYLLGSVVGATYLIQVNADRDCYKKPVS